MEIPEEAPKWFYVALSTGSLAALVTLVGGFFYLIMRQIDSNKNDWTQVKEILHEIAMSIKLHEHRLSEIEKDIERINVVRYNKRGSESN